MLHRNTTVYRRTLELVRLCGATIDGLPRGYALNYAEGSGKASLAERRRFFRIAKASALETSASFDVACQLGALPHSANQHAQDLCDHIAALLHRCR